MITLEKTPTDRPPAKRRKSQPWNWLVPVIFATGCDDDLPGLIAAFRDEAVMFDDKVYAPGEDITIIGRRLCVSADQFVISFEVEPTLMVWKHGGMSMPPRETLPDFIGKPGVAIVHHPAKSREMEFDDIDVWMNWTPLP